MTIRQKTVRFISAGFGLILLAVLVNPLPVLWKGILLFSGNLLMAVGCVFQVKQYAADKTTQYYVMLAFTWLFWIALSALTLFWFARQGGLI